MTDRYEQDEIVARLETSVRYLWYSLISKWVGQPHSLAMQQN